MYIYTYVERKTVIEQGFKIAIYIYISSMTKKIIAIIFLLVMRNIGCIIARAVVINYRGSDKLFLYILLYLLLPV